MKEDNEDGECVIACRDNCNDRGICDIENRTCRCFYGWDGTYCEEARFCVFVVENGIERLNVWNVEYDVNDTIDYVFANSPSCYHDCLRNETLCNGKYRKDGMGNDTIACLIDSNCSRVYALLSNHITIGGIAMGIAMVIAGSAIVIYSLRRNVRKRKFSLDNPPTSMQMQNRAEEKNRRN